MEVEIGRGKKGRRAYGFDDIAIVPSRRTRDPDEVDITWKLGPYRFELPLLASAMDGVVSPETAGIVGRLGGLAVLNLEGVFTRYEDAEEQLQRIAQLPKDEATAEMQRIYQEPIKDELIAERIRQIKDMGVVCAASLTPQRVRGALRGRAGGRARHPGHPGHGHLGRARLGRRVAPAAEPQGVHPRRAGAGRGGRLRLLRHRPAPHAHRRGGRARGRRPRRRLHHPRRAGHRRPAGHRHRRRRRRPLAAHDGDGRVRRGDRRRRHAQRRRHRQGLRLRLRRGHDRLPAGPRLRGARATASTGAWPPSTARSPAARA